MKSINILFNVKEQIFYQKEYYFLKNLFFMINGKIYLNFNAFTNSFN